MSLSDASGHFHLVLLSVRTLGQIRDLNKTEKKIANHRYHRYYSLEYVWPNLDLKPSLDQ